MLSLYRISIWVFAILVFNSSALAEELKFKINLKSKKLHQDKEWLIERASIWNGKQLYINPQLDSSDVKCVGNNEGGWKCWGTVIASGDYPPISSLTFDWNENGIHDKNERLYPSHLVGKA
ncbi:MAG: hypothetical protein NTX25_23695, partial [Proteobacteria bacterium]|nr:hypothetical protein [Pseudomonadota bacterium]